MSCKHPKEHIWVEFGGIQGGDGITSFVSLHSLTAECCLCDETFSIPLLDIENHHRETLKDLFCKINGFK